MKLVVLAAAALAAAPPVASAPGLVVSDHGKIYVRGVEIARGTQPAWNRLGTAVAFIRNGEVFVADADGAHVRRLTVKRPGLHWPANSPAWSPDGARIAFTGTRDVFTVRLVDRKLTQLTHSAHSWIGAFTPAYSPDGRTIAFARNTDAFNSDIFLMRADGTHLTRLTRTQGTDSSYGEEHGPAWSPDGRRIVFVSNRDGGLDLYSIRADGTDERRLTGSAADEDAPRISRDGRRVLFVSGRRIVVMNLDGTGMRALGAGDSADWR
jgi:TolB protein